MPKIIFLVVAVAAIASHIQADADVNSFSQAGYGFPSEFSSFPEDHFPPIKVLTPEDIKNMSPADSNSVVSGASVSSSSSIETVNGVPVKKTSGGRVVTNDNGKVSDISYGN